MFQIFVCFIFFIVLYLSFSLHPKFHILLSPTLTPHSPSHSPSHSPPHSHPHTHPRTRPHTHTFRSPRLLVIIYLHRQPHSISAFAVSYLYIFVHIFVYIFICYLYIFIHLYFIPKFHALLSSHPRGQCGQLGQPGIKLHVLRVLSRASANTDSPSLYPGDL